MVAKIKMADLVLMQRRIQGNKRYMYVQFGVDGKLHVEVTKPWCFMAKEKNGFHRHTHQVRCSQKILTTFSSSRHEDDTEGMWRLRI